MTPVNFEEVAMSEKSEQNRSRRSDDQPPPSKAGAGPDIDKGRCRTQTEKDLRRVQSQYDPKHARFDPDK
jgi:hypothetical protein